VEAEEEGAALDIADAMAMETKWGKEGDGSVGVYYEVVGVDEEELLAKTEVTLELPPMPAGHFYCGKCCLTHSYDKNMGDGCIYCGATVQWFELVPGK